MAALKEKGITPGRAPSSSATTPVRPPTCAASTTTARRWASPRSVATCRRHHAGRARGHDRRAQRQSRVHRLHRAAPAAEAPRRERRARARRPRQGRRRPAPVNLGRLVLGKEAPLPCTRAESCTCCVATRFRSPVPTSPSSVVASPSVARSRLLLTRRTENATVTLCHTGTRDLAAQVRQADIVIAAAGVPGLITADMVKPGAAVLDVGVSRTADGLRGDVADDVRQGRRLRVAETRWCRTAHACLPAHQCRGAGRAARRTVRLGPVVTQFARRNWPLLAVVLVVAAAFVLILADRWRRGASFSGAPWCSRLSCARHCRPTGGAARRARQGIRCGGDGGRRSHDHRAGGVDRPPRTD